MNRNAITFPGIAKTLAQTIPHRNSIYGEINNLPTNRINRITDRSSTSRREFRLKELINIDRDISVFSNDQLNSINPSRLYSQWIFNNNSDLFRHFREVALHCPDNIEIKLNLITSEDAREMKRKNGHSYIHMGLMLLGIRGLARKRIGGKVLECLYDERFSTLNEALIGIIEVDINNNLGIAYIVPDITLTISDFKKCIKILIQSNGV